MYSFILTFTGMLGKLAISVRAIVMMILSVEAKRSISQFLVFWAIKSLYFSSLWTLKLKIFWKNSLSSSQFIAISGKVKFSGSGVSSTFLMTFKARLLTIGLFSAQFRSLS